MLPALLLRPGLEQHARTRLWDQGLAQMRPGVRSLRRQLPLAALAVVRRSHARRGQRQPGREGGSLWALLEDLRTPALQGQGQGRRLWHGLRRWLALLPAHDLRAPVWLAVLRELLQQA